MAGTESSEQEPAGEGTEPLAESRQFMTLNTSSFVVLMPEPAGAADPEDPATLSTPAPVVEGAEPTVARSFCRLQKLRHSYAAVPGV